MQFRSERGRYSISRHSVPASSWTRETLTMFGWRNPRSRSASRSAVTQRPAHASLRTLFVTRWVARSRSTVPKAPRPTTTIAPKKKLFFPPGSPLFFSPTRYKNHSLMSSTFAERIDGSWIPCDTDNWGWTQAHRYEACPFFENARTRCSLDLAENNTRAEGTFDLNGLTGTLSIQPTATTYRGVGTATPDDEDTTTSWQKCALQVSVLDGVLTVTWTFTGGPCNGQTYKTTWTAGQPNKRHCCIIA